MTWFATTLRSSLGALFTTSTSAPAALPTTATLEDIRARMIDLVGLASGQPAEFLARRIRFASDIHSLWFIRSELMAVLARARGEALAREKLSLLGDMFAGHLPEPLRSRPSPLDGAEAGGPRRRVPRPDPP